MICNASSRAYKTNDMGVQSYLCCCSCSNHMTPMSWSFRLNFLDVCSCAPTSGSSSCGPPRHEHLTNGSGSSQRKWSADVNMLCVFLLQVRRVTTTYIDAKGGPGKTTVKDEDAGMWIIINTNFNWRPLVPKQMHHCMTHIVYDKVCLFC